MWLKHKLRSLVFPGLDLHTYSRTPLCRYWLEGPRDVLDAGCGNGYFSYLAFRSGAQVVAMNVDKGQVDKAREYFLEFQKLDSTRISFEHRNLYDLTKETRSFDEILCYETLEHIKQDREVVEQFYRILRPGGVLHLCSPYALHPRHQREKLDLNEEGGHIRAGYTRQGYELLLLPIGFLVEETVGVGNAYVYHTDLLLRRFRRLFGDLFSLPLFFILKPGVELFRSPPEVPFSLYVRALKPTGAV